MRAPIRSGGSFLPAILLAVALVSGCRSGSSPGDASSSAITSPAVSGIARAGWLVGRWHWADAASTFDETWSAPKDGVMIGRGELRKGGTLAFFEDLRIEARGDVLVYVASPNGKGATEFASTLVTADRIRFENPQHDDPKVLDYRRLADGTLQVDVVGSSTQTLLLRRE